MTAEREYIVSVPVKWLPVHDIENHVTHKVYESTDSSFAMFSVNHGANSAFTKNFELYEHFEVVADGEEVLVRITFDIVWLKRPWTASLQEKHIAKETYKGTDALREFYQRVSKQLSGKADPEAQDTEVVIIEDSVPEQYEPRVADSRKQKLTKPAPLTAMIVGGIAMVTLLGLGIKRCMRKKRLLLKE